MALSGPNSSNTTTNVPALGPILSALDNRLPLTIVITSLAVIIAALTKLCYPTLDPSEPPVVLPKVPIIGHLLGIIQHQSNYHTILKYGTLSVPSSHYQNMKLT